MVAQVLQEVELLASIVIAVGAAFVPLPSKLVARVNARNRVATFAAHIPLTLVPTRVAAVVIVARCNVEPSLLVSPTTNERPDWCSKSTTEVGSRMLLVDAIELFNG